MGGKEIQIHSQMKAKKVVAEIQRISGDVILTQRLGLIN